MEGPDRTETKKAVCRSFTNVVRNSPLNGAIDPKSFLLTLNTQFSLLYRNGKLHLEPLWDALQAGGHPTDSLYSLFLSFEEAAGKLGIQVMQPARIAAMSAEDKKRLLLRSAMPENGIYDQSGFTPLIEIDSINPDIEAIPLGSTDIKPLIPEDLRRRVNQSVVQAIRTTPLGARVEGAQVGMWVDANIEQVFDGLRFDFSPLVPALKEVPEVSDAEIYVAAHRLKELLQPMSVEMELPALDVDLRVVADMLAAAQARRASISDPRTPSVGAGIAQRIPHGTTPVGPKPTGDIPADQPQEQRGQKKLEKFGLGKSKLTGKMRFIRPAVLGVVLVATIALLYLNRDDRPLDVEEYVAVFPLHNARLENGYFQGQVDEQKWWKLTYKQREQSISQFEAILKAEGLIPNLQIRDGQNRVVLSSVGSGRLNASQALMRDHLPDGDTSAPPKPAPAQPKGSSKASK